MDKRKDITDEGFLKLCNELRNEIYEQLEPHSGKDYSVALLQSLSIGMMMVLWQPGMSDKDKIKCVEENFNYMLEVVKEGFEKKVK